MKSYKKDFQEELVELLYKYDMSIKDFLEIVMQDTFWIGKYTTKAKLRKILKDGLIINP